MLFNRNGFNSGKFNVPNDSDMQEIPISVYFKDSLRANLSIGVEINDRIVLTDKLSHNSHITIGVPATYELKEQLLNTTHMIVIITIKNSFKENLNSNSYVGKNIYNEEKYNAGMNINAYLGKKMYSKAEIKDILEGEATLGKLMYSNYYVAEILNVNIDATTLEHESIILDVVLRPGEEIEINSNLFTAYNGDENILHLYDGDWIYLDPDSQELVLRTGNDGKIEAKMLYREGWL